MNLFGNKPQEQAMQRLVHDTNSSLQQLHWHIEKLKEWNSKNAKTIDSTTFILAEYLASDEKKLKAAIDAYYEKFKTDFA